MCGSDWYRRAKTSTAELLWSMTREIPSKTESVRKSDVEPLLTTISIEQHGEEVPAATLKQFMMEKDILREPVREKGIVGTLFLPLAAVRYPAIIGFGGSGGGLSEGREALLASQGYAVLALAYFNYRTLPKSLVNVPLEYFGTPTGLITYKCDGRVAIC
ncbi:MAG: acyl-CoA thioesterase/BAAT N-terminal domain-containing protein [Gemmatales bacterium]